MESKTVYALVTGRGPEAEQAVVGFFEEAISAERRKRANFDTTVVEITVYKPDGQNRWFGPIRIQKPTPDDIEKKTVQRQRQELLDRLRGAGFTPAEIRMIQQSDND